MRLECHRAEPADAECIFQMSRENIDRYEDLAAIDYEEVLSWMRRKIENYISEYVCIIYRGERAGYYRFHLEGGKMELDDLYIFPVFQSRGIGTEVINRCLAETEKTVYLYAFVRNVRAVALYRHLGFRVIRKIGKTRCIMERGGTACTKCRRLRRGADSD